MIQFTIRQVTHQELNEKLLR